MNAFIQWVTQIFGAWKPWLVVRPWEIGVRVRLGKTAKELLPGIHLRIPLVDQVEAVNTRLRIVSTPTVTLTNGRDGYAKVITAVVSYRVSDPLEAMMHYTDPEGIATAKAQAEMVRCSTAEECEKALASSLKGIEVESVRYVENVDVRTFRLLQSSWGVHASQDKEKY